MPPKKKPSPNGFFHFMQSLRPQLKREGVVVGSNRELAELAGPRWAELTAEEREPFNAMAKKEKQDKKYSAPRDKMDCTRQYISQRVDTVQLNEQRRKKERKSVVEGWFGRDVTEERFLVISFMSLCDMPDDKYMPCEMGIVDYSLRSGIIRSFHKYIDPGTIPLGYRYEAMTQSEATHKIPPEGFSTETYQDIYDQVLQFVNPRKLNTYPTVYCKASESKLTEFSLDWLASRAGQPNKMKKVYELEGLICDLFAESKDADSKMAPPKHQVSDLVSTSVFDYEAGSRCQWHEENEVRFCALGNVNRYCYCVSDFLCGSFDIELTSNHLPERPDGDSCRIVTPRVAGSNSRPSSARSQTRKEEADMSYGGYGNNNTYQAGVRKKQYSGRAPTYDEESLRSSDDVRPVAASTQSTVPAALASFGRGRGRGHPIPEQPLRRPAMPGIVGAGGEEQHKVETSASSQSQDDLGTPWSGTLGAGRGRGVRLPNTAPKGWAGHASAPDASTAPLPPTSWQHDPQAMLFSGSGATPWQQPNMNIGGMSAAPMPLHTGPDLQPFINMAKYTKNMYPKRNNDTPNLHTDFEKFSLFDRDEYDY